MKITHFHEQKHKKIEHKQKIQLKIWNKMV